MPTKSLKNATKSNAKLTPGVRGMLKNSTAMYQAYRELGASSVESAKLQAALLFQKQVIAGDLSAEDVKSVVAAYQQGQSDKDGRTHEEASTKTFVTQFERFVTARALAVAKDVNAKVSAALATGKFTKAVTGKDVFGSHYAVYVAINKDPAMKVTAETTAETLTTRRAPSEKQVAKKAAEEEFKALSADQQALRTIAKQLPAIEALPKLTTKRKEAIAAFKIAFNL